MSILQDKLSELRYIQRKNLDEEAKIIGNYFRDIIRSFGVDCRYYKLSTNYPTQFSDELSQNNFILNAYGYDPDPNFSISADMITYMEVENDIFNMNKYGVIPDMNVNFYFDSVDFAAALATRIGVLQEYPVAKQMLCCEFTGDEAFTSSMVRFTFNSDVLSGVAGFPLSGFLSSYDLSSGIISCSTRELSGVQLLYPVYDPNYPDPISCNSTEISSAKLVWPVNDVIYKSFQHILSGNTSILDNVVDSIFIYYDYNLLDLKTKEAPLSIENNTSASYFLSGTINGTVLFHGLDKISKYKEAIVPNVGDIVTIDFPDEYSREQFQITECVDKNLSPDGQNPLLHKYYWKCKAKRYVNDYEKFPEKNDANKQMDEKFDLVNQSAEKITEKIEIYPTDEDLYYGGYGTTSTLLSSFDDITKAIPGTDYTISDSESFYNIIEFGRNGAKLMTDGYTLIFYPPNSTMGKTLKAFEEKDAPPYISTQSSQLRFLKATNDIINFIDIEGKVYNLEPSEPSKKELKLCLDTLTNISLFDYGAKNTNHYADNFFKFSNCNTILMVIGNDLYCRLGSGGEWKKLTI